MDETIEKTIYERIINIRDSISSLSFSASERRKLTVWSIEVFRTIIKVYGRDSEFSKQCRALTNTLRDRKADVPMDLLKKTINQIEGLASILEKLDQKEEILKTSVASIIPDSKNVFIIHGHDELNTHRLINLLQSEFQLNPIAIFLKPGQSLSILEKFERHAATCSFAFALFTKDDEIIKKDENIYQARPNVIFESGWFTGRLGKGRIVLLLKNGVKIHSDFDGISRIQFNDNIEEKYKEIKNELEAADLLLTV